MVHTLETTEENLEHMKVEISSVPEFEEMVEIKTPDLNYIWIRFSEKIDTNRPNTFLVLGMRGAGKSALLEILAIRFPKIIDLFGASDNEGLCWCKQEYIQWFQQIYGRKPRILLVTSDSMIVSTEKNPNNDCFRTIHLSEITLQDFYDYDVITTVTDFHETEELYFEAINKIIQILWVEKKSWKVPWFVLIREASNWLYSRMKVVKDDKMAKKEFIKSLREARHHGLAIGLDTLRWTNIDKEIRDLSDYTFIKRTGATLLPDDLSWLYGLFGKTAIYYFMNMPVFGAILSTGRGSVAVCVTDCPEWHKGEKENIMETLKFTYQSDGSKRPDIKRDYHPSNFTHIQIVETYIEVRSMEKVAEQLAIGKTTVQHHLKRHNLAIQTSGKCPKCVDVEGKYSDHYVDTSKMIKRKGKKWKRD